jgi:hypothetical protein
MRQRLLYVFLILVGTIGHQCTEFSYDNPLDPEGINKSKFQEDPEKWLGDHNNDGIENIIDPIYNQDTTLPVIEILVESPVTIKNGDEEQLEFILTQWDATDNLPLTKHDPVHNVNIYRDSCYTVRFSATDSVGNVGRDSLVICVKTPPEDDKTPPILTINDTLITIFIHNTYQPPQYSAFDLVDGKLTDSVKIDGVVDTAKVGKYEITYSVSDAAGNKTEKTIIVDIKTTGPGIDITPPVITLKGADTIFLEKTVDFEAYMDSYEDPGYTAEDDVDGNITDSVEVSDFVKINIKYYYIKYNVTDTSGNHAEEVRRYFDTGKPLPSAPIIELEEEDSLWVVSLNDIFYEPGYQAIDVIDGDITDDVIVDTSEVLENIGTEGTYKVLYTVTNSSGMQTTVTRWVQVVDDEIDTQKPVITLIGRNPDTTLYKSSTHYVDPGATAEDNKDGDITDKITVTDGVNMNSFGKYYVNYRVVDNAGWVGTATRTVYVARDTSTNDLLLSYGVPTEDPLPEMKNLSFTHLDIEGDGPENAIDEIKTLKINWAYEQGKGILREVAFEYNGPPNYKAVTNSVTQSFADMYPVMTIRQTEVSGLDGEYYVTYDGKEFVWVETSGKYALIWTR